MANEAIISRPSPDTSFTDNRGRNSLVTWAGGAPVAPLRKRVSVDIYPTPKVIGDLPEQDQVGIDIDT